VAWWRNGRASDFRPRGHGFDPRSGHSCVTTLGKLFTPTCLDAERLRYYMQSLNRVPLPLGRICFGTNEADKTVSPARSTNEPCFNETTDAGQGGLFPTSRYHGN